PPRSPLFPYTTLSRTHAFAAAMHGVDLALAPASPVLAPPIAAEEVTVRGERRPVRAALLSCVAALSQLDCPIVAVPAGLRRGLPVGLQVIGRAGSEAPIGRAHV